MYNIKLIHLHTKYVTKIKITMCRETNVVLLHIIKYVLNIIFVYEGIYVVAEGNGQLHKRVSSCPRDPSFFLVFLLSSPSCPLPNLSHEKMLHDWSIARKCNQCEWSCLET